MKISRIIWLADIVQKLVWKHNITENEVIEIIKKKSYFRFVEKGHRKGENVYAALGQTNAGRYLIIFFVYKVNNEALIISARDMTKTERKKYEQK